MWNLLRLLKVLPTGPLRLVSPLFWARRVIVLIVVAYTIGNVTDVWWTATHDQKRAVDAIVVLGAAQYNGRPSPALRARLQHAVDLYGEQMAPLIVVTGGRQEGDRTTEAAASANFLLKAGIPDQRILREVQGRDTYGSIAATARILRKRGLRHVVLV